MLLIEVFKCPRDSICTAAVGLRLVFDWAHELAKVNLFWQTIFLVGGEVLGRRGVFSWKVSPDTIGCKSLALALDSDSALLWRAHQVQSRLQPAEAYSSSTYP